MHNGAICMAMSAIPVGPPQYVETYPAVERSVPLVRRNIDVVLQIWSMDHLKGDVLLIATELSSNAIKHCAGKTFDMSIIRLDHGVRITVKDTCAQLPSMRTVADTDESGRGMWIINNLASDWGVMNLPDGKRVWADFQVTG